MKYRCVTDFRLEKVDEDGFHVPNVSGVVPVGSIWYIDDSSIIGGEIHLECMSGTDDFGWIEITDEKLSDFFEPVN